MSKIDEVLKGLEIRFPMPMRLELVAPGEGMPPQFSEPLFKGLPTVCIWFLAADRDGGPLEWRPGDYCQITPDEAECQSAILSKIGRLIHRLVDHEVDESVYLNGVRIWDPHGVER